MRFSAEQMNKESEDLTRQSPLPPADLNYKLFTCVPVIYGHLKTSEPVKDPSHEATALKSLTGPLVVDGNNSRSTAEGNNMDSLEGELTLLSWEKWSFPSLTEHISSLCVCVQQQTLRQMELMGGDKWQSEVQMGIVMLL